jgi:IS30 family transposase
VPETLRLVHGPDNSAVDTLVERKSRFAALSRRRGRNENIHGLLCQVRPIGTDPPTASQGAPNHTAWLVNGCPRKALDWRTSAQAMVEEIAGFSNRVALDY